MAMTMHQLYMAPRTEYCDSPMSFATVPDLMPSYEDLSTDPSPSPPEMFNSLDPHYHPFDPSSSFAEYMRQQQQTQPTPPSSIVNSIEFTDLTQIHSEDSPRRRRRSTTARDKEAATNMRIRRRAQNRASQRAFRERKEKHVQHLEHELEQLEAKHQTLEKNYSEVEGAHAKLQRECDELRDQLARLRSSSVGNRSREGSVGPMTQTQTQLKVEDGIQQPNIFDPFGAEGFFGAGADFSF